MKKLFLFLLFASCLSFGQTQLSLTTQVKGILPPANGGSGLASGTSGGVLAYTASGTLASSAVLTSNSPVLGGGAGVVPKTATFLTTNGSTTLTIGVAAGGNGVLALAGNTSGTATITAPATAGTTANPIAVSNSLTVPGGANCANPLPGYGFASATGTGMVQDFSTQVSLCAANGRVAAFTTTQWQLGSGITEIQPADATAALGDTTHHFTTLFMGNCASGASPAVCGANASGSVAVPTGTNATLVVNTTAVTANSVILLNSDETLGTKLSVTCNTTLASVIVEPVVTARSAGTSFTITISGTTVTNPVCLNYLILN